MVLARNRLTWLGWINVVFGVASLARIIVEIVSFEPSFFESRVATLFTFDAMEATLWIASGLCLLLCDSRTGLRRVGASHRARPSHDPQFVHVGLYSPP